MSPAGTRRPGPLAWFVIAVGWAVMGWAVLGVFVDADRTHPGSWFTWVVGLALVHDLVLLPVVALVGGWLLGRAPDRWRGPVRTGLVVAGVVALATFPVVAAFGARPDNPTVLPLPAGRNLVVVVAFVAAASVLGGWWSSRRDRRVQDGGG